MKNLNVFLGSRFRKLIVTFQLPGLDGLVCIYSVDYYGASVLNISTGQVVSLPFVLNISTRQIVSLPKNISKHLKFAECTYYPCFDPVKKEYKVLNIIDDLKTRERSCEIYTLGTPSRRILTISPKYRRYPLSERFSFSCSVNGVIYWTSFTYQDEDGEDYRPNGHSLIVFDVGKDLFHDTMISERIDLCIEHTLAFVEGKLLLLKQFGDGDEGRGFSVWFLDPDNDQNRFSVRKNIIIHPLLERYREPLILVGIGPMGEIVTTDGDHSGKLYYLDGKRKKLRIVPLTPSGPEKHDLPVDDTRTRAYIYAANYGLPVDDACTRSYIYAKNLVRLRDCGFGADHGDTFLKLA